ncbi:hypothetical protein EI94DRAFT_1706678 [Lactarius quietus]|nr:hypothetical protein EI94DRAFT_1706678 [Lactarius quietus]
MPSPPFRFLRDPVSQPPTPDLSEASSNPWLPFDGRLEYEWAHYHYVRLQSSANDIQHGLDLWRATVAKHRTEEMTTMEFHGRIPRTCTIRSTPLRQAKTDRDSSPWMQDTYELNVRDVLSIFEEQLASKEFDGQFDYVPYEEYDKNGSRDLGISSGDENLLGSMFVPIVAGSDKTSLSCNRKPRILSSLCSLGNITNTAAVHMEMVSFPCLSSDPEGCLALVFQLLKPYMMSPLVLKCPDGHFRRTIFGLGPYIADYPEQAGCQVSYPTGVQNVTRYQVTLMVQKVTDTHMRRLIFSSTLSITMSFGTILHWQPYTHSFPHADIHELLAPDLLHQLIKGVFKDHIVEWVLAYVHKTHGGNSTLDIIEDIDQWISAVPIFPGLRRFADGCNFKQWTGNDSKALMKMLRTLERMDKMMALHQRLEAGGFLQGFGFPFPSNRIDTSNHASNVPTLEESEEPEDEDVIGILGNTQDVSEFDVQLATRPHTSDYSLFWLSECGYPPGLLALAVHIKQPNFPLVFTQFLSKMLHPDKPTMLEECPTFDGAIKVHHSVTATFYAPSDLSGSGGLWRELIRLTPSFYGHTHRDTVFIVTDDSQPGMDGMEIGRVLLFFSFEHRRKRLACALINWFVHDAECDRIQACGLSGQKMMITMQAQRTTRAPLQLGNNNTSAAKMSFEKYKTPIIATERGFRVRKPVYRPLFEPAPAGSMQMQIVSVYNTGVPPPGDYYNGPPQCGSMVGPREMMGSARLWVIFKG